MNKDDINSIIERSDLQEEELQNYDSIKSKREKIVNSEDNWSRSDLSEIKDLESVVADLYADEKGTVTTKTQKTRDGGVDVVVEISSDECILVEVKHWNENTFGINQLRNLIGAVDECEFEIGGIKPHNRNSVGLHAVSTCGFSPDAKKKSSNTVDIELVGPENLIYRLNKSSLNPSKYK